MKIAFIGQKGIPAVYGGVERHVENLSTRLAKAGEKVFVYTRPYYTPKNRKTWQGVKLISLPSLKTKHLDAISHTFLATLHALFQDYDVVHYHAVGPSLLAWLPRLLKPKTKIVATVHCLDRQHQKWGWFARLMLWLGEWTACKFSHKVIAVSKTLEQYLYEVYGVQAEYIPNGIGQTNPRPVSIIAKKFGLEADKYILTVARLVPHKGIHYLIQAFKKIKTDMKLVIVGDSSFTDGYVKKLKRLAIGDKRIVFTGWQTGQALEEFLSNAYLYVQPSESEGLALALLEAASFGRCVLASDIPANLEVAQYCGLTFRNKDIVDLKEKLEMLLRNPASVESTGKTARKFVLENYHWDDITQNTLNLYQNLVFRAKLKECVATSGNF